jgi:parallel beta-helix repeat protein
MIFVINIVSFSLVHAYIIIDDATGGDCTIIGSWNASTKICTLGSNVGTIGGNGIEIDSDNITIDGNGYLLQGDNSANSAGVYVSGKNNVTIKNMSISGYPTHIEIRNSADHNIVNNVTVGVIYIHSSSNIDINSSEVQYVYLYKANESSITDNDIGYLYILMSQSCTILRNGISSGLDVDGDYWDSSHWDHNITISNTMEGRPIYYVKSASDMTFGGSTAMGAFFCVNCDSITVDNLDLHENGRIYLYGTKNSIIKGNGYGVKLVNCSDNYLINNVKSIRIEHSDKNIIENNTITSSSLTPITLSYAANNTVVNNTISGNNMYGLQVVYSFDNLIRNNSVSGQISSRGISVFGSHRNEIARNKITTVNADAIYVSSSDDNLFDGNVADTCQTGIRLYQCDNNIIKNNTFSNNEYGINLLGYMNNVYNNNFINNATQAVSNDHAAIFNLDEPIGGNYWSDWDTPAEGCQDLNMNGFCDSAYSFDSNAQDNLPWTRESGWKNQLPVNIFLLLLLSESGQ